MAVTTVGMNLILSPGVVIVAIAIIMLAVFTVRMMQSAPTAGLIAFCDERSKNRNGDMDGAKVPMMPTNARF